MKEQNIIQKIEEKFTSGNDIEVERIVLTRKEWEEIREYIFRAMFFAKNPWQL